MSIKEFYMNEYPTDELGEELNEKATFDGLLNTLLYSRNVYEYIGVGDSLVRERLFEKAAERINKPYEYVYNLWIN